MLTDKPLQSLTEHIAVQGHAMAGATIASAAALACSLGEACVRLNAARAGAVAGRTAARLAAIRGRLSALADEDGAAITAFAALRAAGKVLEGQDRLCQMPVEMAGLAAEAACLLQDFRPLAEAAQDDLEMAITLLAGAAQAATLLLDSNLRIWPEHALIEAYEPALADLRGRVTAIAPKPRVRP